jgi:hypothetical protein
MVKLKHSAFEIHRRESFVRSVKVERFYRHFNPDKSVLANLICENRAKGVRKVLQLFNSELVAVASGKFN